MTALADAGDYCSLPEGAERERESLCFLRWLAGLSADVSAAVCALAPDDGGDPNFLLP